MCKAQGRIYDHTDFTGLILSFFYVARAFRLYRNINSVIKKALCLGGYLTRKFFPQEPPTPAEAAKVEAAKGDAAKGDAAKVDPTKARRKSSGGKVSLLLRNILWKIYGKQNINQNSPGIHF